MPVIREYSPQVAANYRPLDQPANPRVAEHAGDAGKAMGQAISQLGQTAFNIAEQNDATNAQVQLAQARADFTAKMQRARETGEAADPEYVQSVQDAAQEQAAQIADKMQTRAGANMARAYGANFAAGMQTMAIHDNAAAIGEQAKQSAMDTQNINRNTLRSSPEQFQAILGETMNLLDGPQYAHVDARVRDEMKLQAKQGLALSAVEGVIHTRSPEEAKQILDSGKMDGFLAADGKRTLYAEADQAIRAREAETMRLERQKKLLDEQKYAQIGNDFIARMNTPNGNQLSTRDVVNSDLPWQTKEHFITAIKEGSAAKPDPTVVNALFHRMYLKDGDPKKITDPSQLVPYVGRGLDLTSLDHLNRELQQAPGNKDVGRAASAAHMAFRGSKVGQALPDVAEMAFLDWSNDLRAAREQYRQQNKDPSVLVSRDPKDKDSFLNPVKMSSYLDSANLLTAKAAMTVGPPKVGDVVKHGEGSFRFKGGDPAKPESWEEIKP